MTLILIEGFDGFTASNSVSIESRVGRFYSRYDSDNTLRSYSGHDAGSGNSIAHVESASSAWLWMYPPGGETNDVWTAGFHFYIPDVLSTTNPFFRFCQANVAGFSDGVQLQFAGSGTIEINDGGGTQLAVTSANTVSANTWHHVEVQAKCNSTTGYVELRVDGATVASVNNVDTTESGSEEWSCVALCAPGSVLYQMRFDNLYICNDQGSTNNGFLGECFVHTLKPTSDAGTNDGTPSTGNDHYAMVDEAVPDTDTTYITVDTDGDKEMFGYETLSINSGAPVLGIQMASVGARRTAAFAKLKHVFESGGTESSQNSHTLHGTANYMGVQQIQESNPDTSAAWTESEVNAGTFGVELDAS